MTSLPCVIMTVYGQIQNVLTSKCWYFSPLSLFLILQTKPLYHFDGGKNDKNSNRGWNKVALVQASERYRNNEAKQSGSLDWLSG